MITPSTRAIAPLSAVSSTVPRNPSRKSAKLSSSTFIDSPKPIFRKGCAGGRTGPSAHHARAVPGREGARDGPGSRTARGRSGLELRDLGAHAGLAERGVVGLLPVTVVLVVLQGF